MFNPITGEGIANAEVRLLRNKWGISWEGSTKLIKKAFTDSEGYYKLEKLALGEVWMMVAGLDGYYDVGFYVDGEYKNNGSGSYYVKKRKAKVVDYHAVPYTTLKFNIKNLIYQHFKLKN